MNSEPMLPTSTSPVATPMRTSQSLGTVRTPSSSGNSVRNAAPRSTISTAARQASRACSLCSVNGGPQ
jgi:hypothetical protein